MTLQQIYDILDRALVADKNEAVEEALAQLRQMPEKFAPLARLANQGFYVKSTNGEMYLDIVDASTLSAADVYRACEALGIEPSEVINKYGKE